MLEHMSKELYDYIAKNEKKPEFIDFQLFLNQSLHKKFKVAVATDIIDDFLMDNKIYPF